jgi:glycosyltransferase involved in cell wall biosynthesis
VTAGRLSHEKGFDLLIEALAQCGNPRLRLTILGDGPLRRDLENLVSARGLDAQVRFLGFQKNPYPYFKEADAFIMSSRYEGFPNVVIEAMACGTPVISTPLGPVKEILSLTGGGTIADAFTAEALAKAINSVQVGQRIPPGAVEPFAAATILKEYTQLLLEVVRPCSH